MATGLTPPVDRGMAELRAYERAGCYDAVFLPDDPEILDVFATMAAAGMVTERIRFGTAVSDVIRRHPVLLAHQAVTIDHLTRGRLILGVGAGKAENLLPYGFDLARPVDRLAEALTVVRKLWRGTEPVDFDGEFYQLRGAESALRPYTPGGPPVWIGAQGALMLDLVGQHADGWLPALMPVDAYEDAMDEIDDAALAAGRNPSSITRALFPVIALTDDRDQRPVTDLTFDKRTQASAMCGTVDQVEERLRAYEKAGCEHVVMVNLTPVAYPDQAAHAGGLFDTLASRFA